jgi:beta-lactamase regulating signal transducer with metallopeptidase domain
VHSLLEAGLSNALAATVLALLAAAAGCICRRPAVLHALWLLVLVKLITPPLLRVPLPWPPAPAAAARSVVIDQEIGRQQPDPRLLATDVPTPPTPDLPEISEPHERSREVLPVTVSSAAAVRSEPDAPRPPAEPLSSSHERTEEPSVPAAVSIQSILVGLWCVGGAGWLALALMRLGRFDIELKHAWLAPAADQERVRQLGHRLGLARSPRLWLVPAAIAPMLYALPGTIRLLVPLALWQRLTNGQRDALVLHELAHCKRRDHWLRWVELMVLALFFWHPVAWWARSRLRQLEEELADAWVLWAMPGEAETYARTLLEAVSFLSENRPALPQLASGIGHVHCLRRRLKMIMCRSVPRRAGHAGAVLVVGLWSAGLLCSPVLGQNAPRAEEPLVVGQRDPYTLVQAAPQDRPKERPKPTAPADPSTSDYSRRRSWASEEQSLDASDEVSLLKLQLDGKKAELEEADALVQGAAQRHRLLQQNATAGAASATEMQQAETEARVQAARKRAKEAQVREVELRLQQATRRLSRLRQGDAPRDPGAGSEEAGPYRAAGSSDQRFERLERKLDELTREVSALRQELQRRRFPDKADGPKTPVYDKPEPRKAPSRSEGEFAPLDPLRPSTDKPDLPLFPEKAPSPDKAAAPERAR